MKALPETAHRCELYDQGKGINGLQLNKCYQSVFSEEAALSATHIAAILGYYEAILRFIACCYLNFFISFDCLWFACIYLY